MTRLCSLTPDEQLICVAVLVACAQRAAGVKRPWVPKVLLSVYVPRGCAESGAQQSEEELVVWDDLPTPKV